MEIYKIPAGVYAANCYVIVDQDTDKAIIIDPGGSADELIDFIEKNEFKLEYIILTHGHADHIGGVIEIEKHFNVPVVAHSDEKELLSDSDKNLSNQMYNQAIEITPSILLKDGDKLKLGEIEISVIHTPGHTLGGMALKINDNLFSGDTLFQNSLGRADLYGGNQEDLMNSIREKLFTLDDDIKVWPGHGEKTTIGKEKMFNPFFN